MTAVRPSRAESIRRSVKARLKPVAERWGFFSQTRLGNRLQSGLD